MARRARLVGIFLAVSALAGCMTVPPAPAAPAPTATRRVVIRGDRADAIGETVGAPRGGLVEIRTHERARVWVDATAIADLALLPHGWVLFDYQGDLLPGEVVVVLGDWVLVRLGEATGLVSVRDVVAVLHGSPDELGLTSDAWWSEN